MIDFSEKFMKTKGQTIKHKGKTISMWDRFPILQNNVKAKYKIISTDSEWRQGFAIRTNGSVIFNDVQQKKKKDWIAIWEDIALWEDEFVVKSKNGLLDVKNIWDIGNGVVESWTNGGAMYYEEIPNGRRYYCNDGHFDDDFNDIIFEIVLVK